MMTDPITPAMSTEAFWLSVSSPLHVFPDGIGPWDPSIRYVGPGRTGRVLPQSAWGVDFRRPAYRHDYHYCQGGSHRDRKEADIRFRDECLVEVEARWPSGSGLVAAAAACLARRRVAKMYAAVRLAGRACWG